MSNAGRALALSELRERIERLEHGRGQRAVLPFRVREVDRDLPAGGLALGALHEVMQAGAASEHAASATLFAAGILARNKGPVLWCLTRTTFSRQLSPLLGFIQIGSSMQRRIARPKFSPRWRRGFGTRALRASSARSPGSG
jgi:hypothetical protein